MPPSLNRRKDVKSCNWSLFWTPTTPISFGLQPLPSLFLSVHCHVPSRHYSSHVSNGDPDVLELEKKRNLAKEQGKTSTPHEFAPGFHKLERATTGRVNPDSYIVVLKDGASKEASLQALDDLVIASDDTLSFKEVIYSDWTLINGYGAKLGGAYLRAVLADPNVEYVEEDVIMQLDYQSVILSIQPPAACLLKPIGL